MGDGRAGARQPKIGGRNGHRSPVTLRLTMMMMIMITIMMMTTTQPAVTPSSLSRRYLNYLGHIYLIAFLSYYVQYPALSSRSGIEPAEHAFQRAYPWLYLNIVESGYCDADSFVELLNVLGVILSVVIAR